MRNKLTIAAAALLTGLLLAPFRAQCDDSAAVESFLSRLGLADLRIRHLEKEVAKSSKLSERTNIARRLADVYAERMLSAADDPPRYADLQKRVEKLLADVPAAQTAALQVVLLQADYQRAESLVIAWLDEPGNAAPLREAGAILARIAPQLQTQRQAIAAEIEKLAQQLDAVENEADRPPIEALAAKQQALLARTAYFAGWSNYYLALTKQNVTAAQPEFKIAKEAFCDVLGIVDENDYAEVEVDSLELESMWRSRAVIGLGLAEVALSRPEASQRCFAWLSHASVPPALRDQAAYWKLQAHLNVGATDSAVELASKEIEHFSNSSPGKNSFCIALVRAALAGDGPKLPQSKALADLGIRGLAQMRQYDLLEQLLTKYKVDITAGDAGFYLTWLHGRRLFLDAEKSKSPDDYRAAMPRLSRALSMPDAATDLSTAGQCRYCLAWCQYRLEDYAAAAMTFREATSSLRKSQAEMAEQAAWMECVARQQLATKDKKHAAAAVAALQAFKLSFPNSAQVPKAELLVLKLQDASAGPEASLRALTAIAPGDANYVAAQFELCQLHFGQWQKAKSDEKPELAAKLLAAIDRFHAAAGAEAAQQKLRAALMALEVLAASTPQDEPRAAKYLDLAAKAAATLPASNSALPEYHYRRLQAAQKVGDADAVADAGTWLAEHGAGTQYELPGLVIVARATDRSVAEADDASRAERLEAAAKIYRRLAALLGDSPEAIRSAKNALAVNSKLAHYDEQLGRWSEAATRLERIVEAFPSDKKYLRRAGLAHFHAGQFAEALDEWLRLLLGLKAGSADWLEAKYYQLACLERTDRETARKVWKQFALLYPEVQPAWRDKFAELQKRLES